MRMCKYFLIALFLFVSLGLFSQKQTYSLSLQQSIDYALEHNKTLLNAKDEIALSDQRIKETKAQGLPQIEGALNYNTYFNYEMNIEFGSSGEAPVIDYTVMDLGDMEVLKLLGGMMSS